jgi:hypothetical protein
MAHCGRMLMANPFPSTGSLFPYHTPNAGALHDFFPRRNDFSPGGEPGQQRFFKGADEHSEPSGTSGTPCSSRPCESGHCGRGDLDAGQQPRPGGKKSRAVLTRWPKSIAKKTFPHTGSQGALLRSFRMSGGAAAYGVNTRRERARSTTVPHKTPPVTLTRRALACSVIIDQALSSTLG